MSIQVTKRPAPFIFPTNHTTNHLNSNQAQPADKKTKHNSNKKKDTATSRKTNNANMSNGPNLNVSNSTNTNLTNGTNLTKDTLAPLYKKATTGKLLEWTISVNDCTITTIHGQVGGKLQTSQETVKEGKNIGKVSETTPAQQACNEAKHKWEKQKKKGYVESKETALAGQVDKEMVKGGIVTMDAQTYAKHGHKIVYPAYVQPKLDGERCIAMIENGVCNLFTRRRRAILSVPHINKAIEQLVNASTQTNGQEHIQTEEVQDSSIIILDGELYNHDYKGDKNSFQALQKLIRSKSPKDGYEVVQYHLFDHPSVQGPFKERTQVLKQRLVADPNVSSSLKYVDTQVVQNADEVETYFRQCLANKYEGAMVRNADSLYEHKRSYQLQKIKEFEDDEFDIVDVKEGKGRMEGHAIFMCKTTKGVQFDCKMSGDMKQLEEYYQNHDLWRGKRLTVQYQGFTDEDCPRFPVGLRLYEEDWPID